VILFLKLYPIILTAPLKLGVNVEHSQLATYEMEDSRSKGLGENVCVLFLRANGQKLDDSLLNLLSHNMIIYLNVFHSLMKHGI